MVKAIWTVKPDRDRAKLLKQTEQACDRGLSAAMQSLEIDKEYVATTDLEVREGEWVLTYTFTPTDRVTYFTD